MRLREPAGQEERLVLVPAELRDRPAGHGAVADVVAVARDHIDRVRPAGSPGLVGPRLLLGRRDELGLACPLRLRGGLLGGRGRTGAKATGLASLGPGV